MERLTGITKTAPLPATEVEAYAYDAEGNRLVTHISPAYVTDDADGVLDDGDNVYTWSADGAMTSRTPKNGGVAYQFGSSLYGVGNQMRLDSIAASNGRNIPVYYDPLQRLVAHHWPSPRGNDELYYDGPDVALELRHTASGDQWNRYVHGPGADQPLATESYAPNAQPTPGTGAQYYYHADGEGSIRLLTDSAGQVANRYDYDSFGRRLTAIESLLLQPYGWKGREWVPGPDIYYNRARFYDPLLGRFLSEDPLGYGGGDFNLYSFAWNSPRNWNDPSGLSAADTATLGAAAVSLAPAYQAVGCALNSEFLKVAMALDGFIDLKSTPQCGATGIKPDSDPKPQPQVDGGGGCSPPPPGCPQYSFEAGTAILTKDGPKNIEDVKVGDLLASRDAFTAETVYRPVTELFRRLAPGMVRLSVAALGGRRETYGVTSELPFYKQGKGFTPVRNLVVGDVLLAEGGAKLTVAAIETVDHPIVVYNLEVAQDHSYFVGELRAWVHNADDFSACQRYKAMMSPSCTYEQQAFNICIGGNIVVQGINRACGVTESQRNCLRDGLSRAHESAKQDNNCRIGNECVNVTCINRYHNDVFRSCGIPTYCYGGNWCSFSPVCFRHD